jgi:hypothetical protein
MLKNLIAACTAVLTLSFAATSAGAVTVPFSIAEVQNTGFSCFGQPSPTDTNCQVNVPEFPAVPGVGSPATDVTAVTVSLFTLRPIGNDQNDPFVAANGDKFTFTTLVRILVGVSVYDFSALATVTNWSTRNASNTGLNGEAKLVWDPLIVPIDAPIRVSFLTAGPFNAANDGLPAEISVRAVAPSVVPLPAGVLLLGTALLGLLGLSRRRTPTLA